jgi:hypothetical protein
MSSALRIASCGALIAIGSSLVPAARLAVAPADSQEPPPFTFVHGSVHGKLYLMAGHDRNPGEGYILSDIYEMAASYGAPRRLTDSPPMLGVEARDNVLVAGALIGLGGGVVRLRPGRLNEQPYRVITSGRTGAIGPRGQLAVVDDATRGDDAATGVFVMNLDGSRRRLWLRRGVGLLNCGWLPDGRLVAGRREHGRNNIVIVRHRRIWKRLRPRDPDGELSVSRQGDIASSSARRTEVWTRRGRHLMVRTKGWIVFGWTGYGQSLVATDPLYNKQIAVVSLRGRVKIIGSINNGLEVNAIAWTR